LLLLSIAYLGFCMTYVGLFLATVSERDHDAFLTAAGVVMLKSWVVVPICLACMLACLSSVMTKQHLWFAEIEEGLGLTQHLEMLRSMGPQAESPTARDRQGNDCLEPRGGHGVRDGERTWLGAAVPAGGNADVATECVQGGEVSELALTAKVEGIACGGRQFAFVDIATAHCSGSEAEVNRRSDAGVASQQQDEGDDWVVAPPQEDETRLVRQFVQFFEDCDGDIPVASVEA